MKPSATAKTIKIAMIPLLLGVLYFVLPSKRTAPQSNEIDTATMRPSREGSRPIRPIAIASKPVWPEMSLMDLENTDPFDRRMLFPELQSSATSDANNTGDQVLVSTGNLPEKKEAQKIQAVFQSPSGIAALVGDRVVHVGDHLADGSRVIGITAEHLILAPVSDKTVN